MAFPRHNPAASFSFGDQYIDAAPTAATPRHRPLPTTTTATDPVSSATKGPDPLSDNWSYDSAIGLFTLNTMMPDSFSMDIPDDLVDLESKDFTNVDPLSQPNISGFAITDHSAEDTVSSGSMSSDHDSDDQSWSPTYHMISPLESPVTDNMLSRVQTWGPETSASSQHQQQQMQDPRRRISASTPTTNFNTSKHQRWSSSPDLIPHDLPAAQIPSPTTSATPTTSTRSRQMSRSSLCDEAGTPGGAPSGSNANGNAGNTRNAAKRAAHNVIEKRYRTNMNAKFLSLEKAMSVNGVAKSTKGGSASLKKSEILTNAIGYIQELQEENRNTQRELAMLKQNLLPGGIWRHVNTAGGAAGGKKF